MEPPIRLLSTDFDGTLFAEFEAPPIPAKLAQLIGDLQARGATWVINTGRDMASLLESLGRSHIHILPDYLVLVEREIFERRGARFVGIQEWNERCSRDHAELFGRIRPHVPRLVEWVNARFEATIFEDMFSPLCIIAANNGDMDAIHAELERYCAGEPLLTVVRNDVYARFGHTAYNKGTALAEITRRLGLQPAQVFAAGDHFNDLPMLSLNHAGAIAAPANAVPAVQARVREQGGYVSQWAQGNGVWDALNHFLKLNDRTAV